MKALVFVCISLVLLAAIGVGVYFILQANKITGRYVKLTQPTANCMNIGDIQVFSGETNVAKGKIVTMSSKYAATDFPVSNLVDEVFTNFAHTSCKEKGWMTIDLGSDHAIDTVKVVNRKDCCTGRIVGATLEILDGNNQVVYTSKGFNGKIGETIPGEDVQGFAVYTMKPPDTTVHGSDT